MACYSSTLLMCFTFVLVNAINRPVYKIDLTQKGYAQFIEYNIETPPLREFTICTWIRVYDVGNEQVVLAYVTKGNNRVLRLWLDSGGRFLNVSINGRSTSVPVNIVKDVWRHVCLSYQSDYGAWALYLDSRLAHCEASQTNYGFTFPRGGNIIIGYGISDSGKSHGFEGEIFGVNMILISTIERNFTTRKDPFYEQKPFPRNKVNKIHKNKQFVVLNDLQTGEIHNNFEKTAAPSVNTNKSFIKFQTPFSYLEHKVGVNKLLHKTKQPDVNNEKDFLTLEDYQFSTTESDKIDLWNIEHDTQTKSAEKLTDAGNEDMSGLSEYETPPPRGPPSLYFDTSTPIKNGYIPKVSNSSYSLDLSEIDVPPPIDIHQNVYGQWTSSKYAGTVLNYLKSINFHHNEKNMKRTPNTIPLAKLSDSYPYASVLNIQKLRPPPQFNRRNLVERQDIPKRDPQINVQILEDDLRSNIIKMHAQTHPKQVEITNRGKSSKLMDHRFYRNANFKSAESVNDFQNAYKPSPFMALSERIKKHRYFDKILMPKHKHPSVLPFLKSLENNMEMEIDKENSDVTNSNDMYSKSLATENKWHNVKSYSNDFTPRRIKIDSEENTKKYPALRLKYKPQSYKVVEEENPNMVHGRKLVNEVFNPRPDQIDSVHLIKYNHGHLPSHNKQKNMRSVVKIGEKDQKDPQSFNRPVKIGNALNEKHILKGDIDQANQSFEGGIDSIPVLNRYKNYLAREDRIVPTSPGQRHCKNVELFDRILYIQLDESIDMTHILSPVRSKNLAIEFILQNYKKCTLADSLLQNNSKLLIEWSTTPVHLFGGACPRTTTDLCGFF